MNETDRVLELFKSKYGWDYFDTLTSQGKKLVCDTINALDEIRENPLPVKTKWFQFWK